MNTFLVSDTHFGHMGVCQFMSKDDPTVKLRPWSNPDEMDYDMVAKWNSVVRPNDRVYHLGDVVINRKKLPILDRLNGRKVLIKGNHDIFKLDEYAAYFDDIRACHVLNGLIMTHIPIHPASLSRFGTNIHGHWHDREVLDSYGKPDPRYICVCVEQTDFAPIAFDEVQKRIVERGGSVGFN